MATSTLKTKKPKAPKQPKEPLSPQEREINRLFIAARNRFQIGQIKTLGDLCKVLGTDIDTVNNYLSIAYLSKSTPEFKVDFQLIDTLKQTILTDLKKREDTLKGFTDSANNVGNILAPTIVTPQEPSPSLNLSKIPVIPEVPYPARNPRQTANLFYYQDIACKEIWQKLMRDKLRAVLLRCNTREGKTYAIAQILRWLVDSNYFEGKTLSPYRILFVTKATIVEQSRRVLENEFGLDPIEDFYITNYDSLRAKLGKQFIREKEIVRLGEIFYEYEWKIGLYPLVVIWDECQSLKNEGSEQSKVAQAYQKLLEKDPNIIQIFSSATPFSRVSQAKVFAVATQIPFTYGMGENPLNNLTWTAFAEELVGQGANPYQYSKSNIKRLMERFKPWIVSFKNVRYKYKAINRVEIIDFPSPEVATEYLRAWEEYVKEKARIERRFIQNSGFLVLAQFTIYRKKAERLRYKIIAERMYNAVNQYERAALCACAFKGTIAAVVTELYKTYGVGRDKISLIWGGDSKFTESGKGKYSDEDIKRILLAKDEEIDRKVLSEVIKQLEYTTGNLGNVLPAEFDLGPQSRERRQEEIDKFQTPNGSDYCLYTFGAGGIGISLHQYIETLRPRSTLATPIYNEMEMMQALGRAHGPNSKSETQQSILLFRDTIEEAVLGIYNAKKTCLDVVIEETKSGGGEKLNEKFREYLENYREYASVLSEEADGEKDILTENDYEELQKELENEQSPTSSNS